MVETGLTYFHAGAIRDDNKDNEQVRRLL